MWLLTVAHLAHSLEGKLKALMTSEGITLDWNRKCIYTASFNQGCVSSLNHKINKYQ